MHAVLNKACCRQPCDRCTAYFLQIIKLGEGTYGEAFKAPSSGIVFKLVPMEGDNLINGYEQKKAGDLLTEAIIASTLSALAEEADPLGALVCVLHVGLPYVKDSLFGPPMCFKAESLYTYPFVGGVLPATHTPIAAEEEGRYSLKSTLHGDIYCRPVTLRCRCIH